MGRQFRMFMLPDDLEELVGVLRMKTSARLLQETAPAQEPVELASPYRANQLTDGKDPVCSHCYLAHRQDSDHRMHYFSNRGEWLIDQESEVIQISGFDFNGKILKPGRFWFQTTLLRGNSLVPQRKEFLSWADQVFRIAKNSLRREPTLDAYIGPRVETWRLRGGRLALIVPLKGEPRYADEDL
jgi:hypothetical protein